MMHVDICVLLYYGYVCMYVCTYVCTYVHMYVCMYMCTYVYMYVCTYMQFRAVVIIKIILTIKASSTICHVPMVQRPGAHK